MKVGIVGAMEEELEPLRRAFNGPVADNGTQGEFVTGRLGDLEVALVRCGVGKVNAAVATALLLKEFKPDFLINSGVAGGFKRGVAVGDIVVSSELRHYDADATVFSYARGQIPMMPVCFKSDTRLLQVAEKAGEEMNTRVHFGQVLSGDSFIHNEYQISDLQHNFPHALAVEMEGAAVAQTGYLFSTPFIVVRAISDQIQGQDNDTVYTTSMASAAAGSCSMVLTMLEYLQRS